MCEPPLADRDVAEAESLVAGEACGGDGTRRKRLPGACLCDQSERVGQVAAAVAGHQSADGAQEQGAIGSA